MHKQCHSDLRLIALFCVGGALVCAVLLSVVYFAAVEADRAALRQERGALTSAIVSLGRRIDVAIAPRATLDDAVRHLDNRFDRGWADANLGRSVQPALSVDVTAVVHGDGRVLYVAGRHGTPSGEEAAALVEAARPLIAQVRRKEAQRGQLAPARDGEAIAGPIQASAVQAVAGQPHFLSVSLVQPDFGEALPRGDRASVIIAGRALNHAFLKLVSDRFMVRDLQMDLPSASVARDRAVMVLNGADSAPAAVLHWRAQQPGLGVFHQAAPLMGAVLLALAAGVLLLARRNLRIHSSLVRSEARLSLALTAANAAAMDLDFNRGQFWCSPEFIEIVGHRLSYEHAAQLPWACIYEEDHDEVVRGVKEALSTGEQGLSWDVRVVRPDGELRWVRMALHFSEGRATGLVLDVHDRKQQELALVEAERTAHAAVEAKARFLATVSHEIRTPLNGVLGVLHLLGRQNLPNDGAGLVSEALACGQMLAGLVDDVLDFSKIEAGQLELAPAATDPADVLRGVLQVLRPQCEAKGIALSARIEDDLGWVELDAMRLRQALFNLIGNGVKFTSQGGVDVRLRRTAQGRLRFEVADTGVGIPEAVQAHVFERFHQGDSSTTRRFGGTGLGLSITRRLAQLMGGDVGFISREGEGSTFWLELTATAVPAPGAVETGAEPLRPLRVLVVEDNATNRLVATRLLEAMGLRVETADDGAQGVEAAARGAFDLILMDVQMPVMDGMEATRRIRMLGGPAARTPVIALTANAMRHQQEAYLAAGMDGVAAKPISPAVLAAEIARVTSAPYTAAAAAAEAEAS